MKINKTTKIKIEQNILDAKPYKIKYWFTNGYTETIKYDKDMNIKGRQLGYTQKGEKK